jgi:hypothetical protein
MAVAGTLCQPRAESLSPRERRALLLAFACHFMILASGCIRVTPRA